MAPKRFSRSSATRKARPNPDDPRTFGANTAMPAATSDWNREL
jgi:hypothetical protein